MKNIIILIPLILIGVIHVNASDKSIKQGTRNIIQELQQLNQAVSDLNKAKKKDAHAQAQLKKQLDGLAEEYHKKPPINRESELYEWRKKKMHQFRQTERSLDEQSDLIATVLRSTSRIRDAMKKINVQSPQRQQVQELTNDKLRAVSMEYQGFLRQNMDKLDPQLVQHYNLVVRQLKSVPDDKLPSRSGSYNLTLIQRTERQIQLYQSLLAQVQAVNARNTGILEQAILSTVQSRIAKDVENVLNGISLNPNDPIDLYADGDIHTNATQRQLVDLEDF